MNLVRLPIETQRAFVERTLRETGEIATFDALYETTFPDGRRTSVTRLAAIIFGLRADGWPIETDDEHGQLAVYRLIDSKPQPVRVQTWRCLACGGPPRSTVTPMLGDAGQAWCGACGKRRMFRSAA